MADEDTPQLPDVPPDDRARIVEWFNHRWELIESAHAERVEMLRTVGEHPSPIFARMVKKFASLGLKPNLVAKLLDVGVGTLARHYQPELDLGLAETLAAVSTNMLRISMSEDNAVAAKVGMRILESSRQSELAQPVKTIHVDESEKKPPVIDSSKLTAAQRQQLREMLTYVAQGGEGEPPTEEETDPVIP